MSNDTTVHVALSSRDRLMVLAAVAYLRNKDRGWDLTLEEVKRSPCGEYYGARLYGWANENSWNYHITGECGELADLSAKFPELEIDGYYRDEYSFGSLYGGSKSYEYSHNSDGGGRSLEIVVGSLRHLGADMSDAADALFSFIGKSGPYAGDGWGTTTPPDDSNYAASLEFSLNDDARPLEDEELCQHFQSHLKSLGAPKDFIVKIKEYYGDTNCELPVWGEQHVHFKKVAKAEVDEFMVKVHAILAREPEDLLDNLEELKLADLGITDSKDSNVLHYAADLGLLDQLPDEFLTTEYLLTENDHRETPIALAIESGNLEQLPEPFCDENFPRNHERQQYLQQLMKDGREDLALEIARNFPNPLLQDKVDRVENLQRITSMVAQGMQTEALDLVKELADASLCRDMLEEFTVGFHGNPELPDWMNGGQGSPACWNFLYRFMDLCAELIPEELAAYTEEVTGFFMESDSTGQDLMNLQRFLPLEWLDLSECEALVAFDFFGLLPELTRLAFGDLPSLDDLTPLGKLTNLTELNLFGNTSLKNLSPLAGLTNLTELDLNGCVLVKDLSPLEGLTDLNTLNLQGCSMVEDLSPLEGLNALTNLVLSQCSLAKDLSSLRRLKNLQWLHLSGLTKLEKLDALADLSNLEQLDLDGCSSLVDVSTLGTLSSLHRLDLSSCSSLSDLSPLSGMESLQTLNLSGCSALTDFSPLRSLSNLSSLELADLPSLKDLSPLGSLSKLHYLVLSGCSLVTDLTALLPLENLSSLDLSGSSPELPLEDLRQFTGLHYLSLNQIESLENIDFLAEMVNLVNLSLEGCSSLTNLDGLSGLANLDSLCLYGCDALENLDGIAHLKKGVVVLPEHLLEQ